ncbi:M16 family metallopeptidase [Marininema halotolerans]|uniref:Predicted Zn-dependent peptidase n=1 Tax=Marininema halotolerans TaxID=1155944 RepID=A0A1I6R4X0_9BACL|nr:pitrilysin family protein [Marininema halotolerans]SFS59821.1 Predicted Zn-dependent peptidase [Marininema halotolerans]
MIQKYTLPNGVRVVAESIPHVRSVAFGLWIGTGSRFEMPHNNGISHFLEHMMFKGTKTRTARQLAETFDEVGGHVNAFTSKEITCYYAKVLDEHLEHAMDVLADMFFESTFQTEEIQKERKVIEEEIRMVEDTPDDIIHDWLSEAAYSRHPLGYPVLGTLENLQTFDRETVLDYRDRHYRPEELVIAVAGNLPTNWLAQVEARFSHFTGKGERCAGDSPVYTGETIVRAKGTEQTHICLGFPGIALTDERIYSLILLNNILGGNMSSRLFQEIREERGLAYSVYSYHSAYQDSGLFTIYAGTGHDQAEDVTTLILDTIDKIRQDGVTENELQKGKEQLKGSLMMSLESTNNRMSRLGKNELLLGRHMSLDEVVSAVGRVHKEDLLSTAQTIFSQPIALSLLSPTGKVPAAYRRNALVV